jgi:hypothetical protein
MNEIHNLLEGSLTRLTSQIAKYHNISNILNDLEEKLDIKFGWKGDIDVYTTTHSIRFIKSTVEQMKSIRKILGITQLTKEINEYGLELRKDNIIINGFKLDIIFGFDVPESCTMKYKTVKKIITNHKLDKDGNIYVEKEVFDGYDCDNGSLIDKIDSKPSS